MKTEVEIRQELGLAVRALRLREGCSQMWLAGRLGWRQAFIAEIESGKANLTVARLLLLASALGVRGSDVVKMVEGGKVDNG